MNRSALKKYAPQARLDFIEAVTQRACKLGLDPSQPASIEKTGDVLLINGHPFPAKISAQRDLLATRIKQQGFDAVMEAMAYTWFNRFAAIRFMELKGYFSHGFRVLSHPEVGHAQPEILEHVQHVELADLDKAEAIRLKTAGDQDEALYRAILIAQCHELYRNMPFLFEQLDDATELLLPDNLLRTDSVIAHLVDDIDEADWEQVEIIGWLYQFYISEKKDQVIGKVVKSEDIPAATQLFTPNWIVKYLVQNSVGRLWLQANPHSTLANDMAYYIQPAEQTPEVQAQLDALIQTRIAEDGDTLNPESITVLDPACGSGHILVEAYDLLKAIYLERGYRLRDIPKLILKNNLFGLEIDDRAAQLAGFALLMKARADDPRLFDDTPTLHVMALQDSYDLDDEKIAHAVFDAAITAEGGEAIASGQLFGGSQLATQHSSGLRPVDLRELIQLFAYGKTFGSLLVVPPTLVEKLPKIDALLSQVIRNGDELSKAYALQLHENFLKPAQLLRQQYDAVIANPPYMGSKGMNSAVKDFAKARFSDSKSDLFAMFVERGFGWCKTSGFNSMVTMQSWMFLSSYESMRQRLLADRTLSNMVHMGNGVMGIAFGTAATVFWCKHIENYEGSFSYCENGDVNEVGIPKEFPVKNNRLKTARPDDFKKIPGSPIAYWASSNTIKAFSYRKIGEFAETRLGMATADNNRFLRYWYEIDASRLGWSVESRSEAKQSGKKWFLYQKGGDFRKWFGNTDYVVNWADDGREIQNFKDPVTGRVRSHNYNLDFIFKLGVTWSALSSAKTSARISINALFDNAGSSLFAKTYEENLGFLALLNSSVIDSLIKIISPTLNYQPGDISKLPVAYSVEEAEILSENSEKAIDLARLDWDLFETSSGFKEFSILPACERKNRVFDSWVEFSVNCGERLRKMREIEEKNNSLLISAYGLQDELNSIVPEDQITMARADREKDMQRLISYAIGCMMGRYTLDEPGLIYAHSGNIDFNPGRYKKFPADQDGIIPLTDELWFDDDAAERIAEFLEVVWSKETLVENMEWLADSLGRKANESAAETIRRYLSSSFYKDHLQTYKKRPIYWLFSSGKQKAFECLVYLHRYNEGTLSRMRMEYVVPLQSRMQARIDKLTDDIASASSSSQQKSLQKKKDKLIKQLEELRRFDENLRTYADKRITLDLDDGVKVNYGKFGDLLAEVKAVTGGDKED